MVGGPHRSLDHHIGNRLRQLRESRKLGQEDVGEILEVSLQQISRFETGAQRLRAAQLYMLARGLDVPVSWFYGGYKESDEEEARIKTFLKRESGSWQPATDPELEKSLLVAFRGLASQEQRQKLLSMVESFASEK